MLVSEAVGLELELVELAVSSLLPLALAAPFHQLVEQDSSRLGSSHLPSTRRASSALVVGLVAWAVQEVVGAAASEAASEAAFVEVASAAEASAVVGLGLASWTALFALRLVTS